LEENEMKEDYDNEKYTLEEDENRRKGLLLIEKFSLPLFLFTDEIPCVPTATQNLSTLFFFCFH
jgi:hypothetical protein